MVCALIYLQVTPSGITTIVQICLFLDTPFLSSIPLADTGFPQILGPRISRYWPSQIGVFQTISDHLLEYFMQ